MKRRPTHELLDDDSGTATEITESLRDLQSFNQRLGGIATTRELIRRIATIGRWQQFSLLEVAAGTGFVPTSAAEELRLDGVRLNITLLDRAATHLPKNGSYQKVVADALTLPFADSSFDVVSSSLFLHHLSPDQVVLFARESLRVARIAFLVNDLIRHPLHLALAYAGAPLYRSRLTRHDAPASVKQAYTPQELRALLVEGGAKKIELQRHYLFRMGLVAWKFEQGQ